jgi:aminopeptidase N
VPRPLYVLASGGGLGYGLFILDDESRDYLLENVQSIPDALTRGCAWVTLWDNLLERRLTPDAFLDLVITAAPVETDEQILQRVLAYATRVFWRHLASPERVRRAPLLEATLRRGIERGGPASVTSAWFAAFRDVALTAESVTWLEGLWRRHECIAGLTFGELDEIAMAVELAVREVPASREILQLQHERTQDPDRRARLAFSMPALSADTSLREQAFARLAHSENRQCEPWVLESMRYLNHPLREAHARRFIQPSLALLPEIQRTSDIFFPTRWVEAALSGHRSPEAAGLVREFLARELQYPQRLRWMVLSAADELFRVTETDAPRRSVH